MAGGQGQFTMNTLIYRSLLGKCPLPHCISRGQCSSSFYTNACNFISRASIQAGQNHELYFSTHGRYPGYDGISTLGQGPEVFTWSIKDECPCSHSLRHDPLGRATTHVTREHKRDYIILFTNWIIVYHNKLGALLNGKSIHGELNQRSCKINYTSYLQRMINFNP